MGGYVTNHVTKNDRRTTPRAHTLPFLTLRGTSWRKCSPLVGILSECAERKTGRLGEFEPTLPPWISNLCLLALFGPSFWFTGLSFNGEKARGESVSRPTSFDFLPSPCCARTVRGWTHIPPDSRRWLAVFRSRMRAFQSVLGGHPPCVVPARSPAFVEALVLAIRPIRAISRNRHRLFAHAPRKSLSPFAHKFPFQKPHWHGSLLASSRMMVLA